MAKSWQDRGFDGCWVLALGTNEAANVAAGSNYGFDQRIDRMMQVADGDPVLWINTKSLLTDGPYAEPNMERWDQALLDACDKYPNMRIYDWASDVKDNWFIDDGIHYTTPGLRGAGTADRQRAPGGLPRVGSGRRAGGRVRNPSAEQAPRGAEVEVGPPGRLGLDGSAGQPVWWKKAQRS